MIGILFDKYSVEAVNAAILADEYGAVTEDKFDEIMKYVYKKQKTGFLDRCEFCRMRIKKGDIIDYDDVKGLKFPNS